MHCDCCIIFLGASLLSLCNHTLYSVYIGDAYVPSSLVPSPLPAANLWSEKLRLEVGWGHDYAPPESLLWVPGYDPWVSTLGVMCIGLKLPGVYVDGSDESIVVKLSHKFSHSTDSCRNESYGLPFLKTQLERQCAAVFMLSQLMLHTHFLTK